MGIMGCFFEDEGQVGYESSLQSFFDPQIFKIAGGDELVLPDEFIPLSLLGDDVVDGVEDVGVDHQGEEQQQSHVESFQGIQRDEITIGNSRQEDDGEVVAVCNLDPEVLFNDVGIGVGKEDPVGLGVGVVGPADLIGLTLEEFIVDEVEKGPQGVAYQRQEDDVFDDLVEQQGVGTLECVPFDVFIEGVHFDNLDEDDEVVAGVVVGLLICGHLHNGDDQAGQVNPEVDAGDVLDGNCLAFIADNPVLNVASVEGHEDIDEHDGDEEAVEVVVEEEVDLLVGLVGLEALHHHCYHEIYQDEDDHEELPHYCYLRQGQEHREGTPAQEFGFLHCLLLSPLIIVDGEYCY